MSALYGLERPQAKLLFDKLRRFVFEDVIPSESALLKELQERGPADRFPETSETLENLKQKAKALGLWNLFLPSDYEDGPKLTALEYAHMAELMGWSPLAAVACNCSAPDTGNMEVLIDYGTPLQQKMWLNPLLRGDIRSAFLMTEPEVASSDARNISTSLVVEGDTLVISGKKWWATGAMNPRCKVFLVLARDAQNESPLRQHSIVLVPRETPGVDITRPLTTFGYDDAPEGHAEVHLNVRVPASNLVGSFGGGFSIAQSRLGRGRIHHCMRAIGLAERCFRATLARVHDEKRRPFGKLLAEQATVQVDLAESRIAIHAARLMVLDAAAAIDRKGAKEARKEISMIKVFVPRYILDVIDRAIQIHGAAGVSQDTILARAWAGMRTLRIADGPDIVHLRTLGLRVIGSRWWVKIAWKEAYAASTAEF